MVMLREVTSAFANTYYGLINGRKKKKINPTLLDGEMYKTDVLGKE